MGNRFDEEWNRARGNISDLTTRIGLASKKEIDELRDKLDELSQKLDTLNQKNTSKEEKKEEESE
jgi:polyhydroxyalkanoate synthesis regulator phasin